MHRPNFFAAMLVGFVLTIFAFAPQNDAPTANPAATSAQVQVA